MGVSNIKSVLKFRLSNTKAFRLMKLHTHILHDRPANFHQPLLTLTNFSCVAEQCLVCVKLCFLNMTCSCNIAIQQISCFYIFKENKA